MNVKIKLIENGKMPKFQRTGDACADCYSRTSTLIQPHSRKLIDLGFALELPEYTEAIIRPRSGLSKNGIDVCIGTCDETYRGELKANVVNTTDEPFFVNEGDRICQLAIRRTEDISFEQVDELSDTERGVNGFGSSGVR